MTIQFEAWELALIDTQRVAHLATVNAVGQPSVVPVVYAFDGTCFVTPLDGKPKRARPEQLRRVRDILEHPQAALVVDQYAEDWSHLAWLQVRGNATLLEGGELYDQAIALLVARYPQYGSVPLQGRPLITLTPVEVRRWRASRPPPG